MKNIKIIHDFHLAKHPSEVLYISIMKPRRDVQKTARWMRGGESHPRARRFRDLSRLEDSPKGFRIIAKIAAAAGRRAAAEATAAGLPHVFVRGRKLISKSADGTEIIIKARLRDGNKPYFIKYKPSTILHAAKK